MHEINNWISIISLLISVLSIIYARKSARAARQANEDARDRYVKSQRPWIGYENGIEREIEDQAWHPHFAFKNVGTNPLHELEVTVLQGPSGKELAQVKRPAKVVNSLVAGEIFTLDKEVFAPVKNAQPELFVRISFSYKDSIMGITYTDQPPLSYTCLKNHKPFVMHTPAELINRK